MPQKSIYTLLIAINDYRDGIRPLNGCLNDMRAFHDYLAKQCKNDEYQLNPLILENGQATRQAIIDGFQHFQSAAEGDICVLYFSGHGSRIDAFDFWEAPDGKNEAIVCYDSCLADKELSCLIYEATKDKSDVHFLAIMDCCHSGSNTRYDDGTVARMSDPNHYPLSIAEYYGYNKNLYIQNEEGKYSAPKGRHIQIGACRNHETAKETLICFDIRGAFTWSLIETLDTTTSILSYADLERRIGQKIENRVANQRPQLDAVNGASIDSPFLGGALLPKNRYFISWDKKDEAWELNAGIYNGISHGKKPSKIFLVSDSHGHTEGVELRVNTVFADCTSVSVFGNRDVLDKKKQYDVNVEIGGGKNRCVAFFRPNGTREQQAEKNDLELEKQLRSFFSEAKTSYIHLCDELAEADFIIHIREGKLFLRQSCADEPLFYPLHFTELKSFTAIDFWQKVDAVMQWFHLKNLDNPVTSIRSTDVEIQLFRKIHAASWWTVPVSTMEPIENWRTPTLFPYQKNGKGTDIPSCFAMKITNRSHQTLFVSALFMDARFGIDNKYLPITQLGSDNEVWLSYTQGAITTKSMGLGIDEDHYAAGLTEELDYIKVIASTQDFDTNPFVQEPLNIKGTQSAMRGEVTKGIMLIPTIQLFDWAAFLVPLHVVRG